MRLVIVTGMSGAGKTIALKMMEDFGFYCVDNLPIPLLEQFHQMSVGNHKNNRPVALGIDIRSGGDLDCLEQILTSWDHQNIGCQILFLDAQTGVLIKRYKESRRAHPLAGMGRLDKGIEQERLKVDFLRQKASYIIDTSQLLTRELRKELKRIFVESDRCNNLFLTVLSFGFKYGIPVDADLVFDVRFLPNPHYEDTLKALTGEQREVQDFVMQGGIATQFLDKLYDMLTFLIPQYIQEGKNQLVIAIGCTGGKHRSVTIAGQIAGYLQNRDNLGVKVEHRDIGRE